MQRATPSALRAAPNSGGAREPQERSARSPGGEEEVGVRREAGGDGEGPGALPAGARRAGAGPAGPLTRRRPCCWARRRRWRGRASRGPGPGAGARRGRLGAARGARRAWAGRAGLMKPPRHRRAQPHVRAADWPRGRARPPAPPHATPRHPTHRAGTPTAAPDPRPRGRSTCKAGAWRAGLQAAPGNRWAWHQAGVRGWALLGIGVPPAEMHP